ncbi:MAG: arsenate reductase ArsC, partial [Alphaproteobacteria bacterium]|nr:arsenate reductase ArsC [Alphaproteobacteria bacterium]
AVLEQEKISTTDLTSKSWDNLPIIPDIVITVCADAASEACPVYLGSALRVHWGLDDPVRVIGSDEEINAAFMNAYRFLYARIEAFFALPLNDLKHDKILLKNALDKLANNPNSVDNRR